MTIDEALFELSEAADLQPFDRLTRWQQILNEYAATTSEER